MDESQIVAKKLLLISGFWPTWQNPITGVFIVQQVAAFVRLGIEVTVLLPNTVGRPLNYVSVKDAGLPDNLVKIVTHRTLRVPERLSKSILALQLNSFLAGKSYRSALAHIEEKEDPYDGCILHSGRYASLSLPHWRDLLSCKVALVIHGVDPLVDHLASMRDRPSIMAKCAKKADTVVLVGSPLLPYAKKLGIPESKQTIVGNGTVIPPRVAEEVIQRKSKRRRVVSVSNLVKLKGVDENIIALASIKKRRPELDFEYIVVGEGPELATLKALAERLELQDRVIFLGRLPYEQTMAEIEKADIFSLPSWGEAFGIVYLEAMARAKPVIGCLGNGAEDIFENGVQGYLVKPHDIKTLSTLIEALLEDPQICNSLGSRGRVLAESFTWESNALRMLEVLGFREGGSF